jgi:glutathione peroxidase
MTIYDYNINKRDWSTISMEEFKWKMLIIVNTATGCWFTPQYEWLEYLYKKYHNKWLEILDFPCNQFGHQAPGDNDEIHQFCTSKYNTTFDQFAKVDVNWENECPLFTYIKWKISEDEIKWLKNRAIMAWVKQISSTCKKKWDIIRNFTKFLVSKDWEVIKRYSPTYLPNDIESDIINHLE